MDVRLPEPLSFDGNLAENFRRFKQSFEIYLIASGKSEKDDKMKIALLLNLMGEEGIEVYNTLKLTELQRANFQTVLNELENYMTPKKNVVYERFLFYSRKQEDEETFDHFYTELKKLSKNCEFEQSTDSMIRDRIVLGIKSRQVQEKLLNVDKLDLNKAIELCRACEIAKSQIKSVQGAEAKVEVVKNKAKTVQRHGNTEEKTLISCKSCGKKHEKRRCPAFGRKCNKCRRYGHFEKMCRSTMMVKELQESKEEEEDEELLVSVVTVSEVKSESEWIETLEFGKQNIRFKVDTGSQVNLIPQHILKSIKNQDIAWQKTKLVLETYGGFKITPIGVVKLKCKFRDKDYTIQFVVVKDKSMPILSLQSSMTMNILKKINEVNLGLDKNSFINNNKDLFIGIGKFKEQCKLKVKNNASPVAKPPRRVPLSIKDRLKKHLDALVNKGIIAKHQGPTEWLSNLVIIEKSDKTLRVCLDPKNLNEVLEREYFEIPTLEEICVKLKNKSYFTVLDFKDGFYQVELDLESSKLCAFGTPFGVYRFLRLPFGLNCAPEYFQKLNQEHFGDIPGVIVYFDDILIAADTSEEHDKILTRVLERAKKYNVKFNSSKIQYKVREVNYLGNIFDREGMRPDKNKIKAIQNLEQPNNKKELQKLLGMINYLRRYIPNLSEISAPLRILLKNNTDWIWTDNQTKCLQMLKNIVSSAPVLANFDVNKEITIQTDSSQSGVGCVLLQENRPVAFGSRALTDSETRFSQIEKEMNAILYSCQKYHSYIYGRKVKILTDHKPLVSIMKKGVADVSSPRLQRIKVKLLKYDIDVQYLPGKDMLIADLLSRNYIKDDIGSDNTFLTEIVHSVNVTDDKLKVFQSETSKDFELKLLKEICLKGWPKTITKTPSPIRKYYNYKTDIYTSNDIMFLGDRIIVPETLRTDMLTQLHANHYGITKTQKRAKSLLYWPGINEDIKEFIKKCKKCEVYQKSNIKEPMILRKIPDLPFQKLASDILEWGGQSYIVIIDYYSKWIELICLQSKTSKSVIDVFKQVFSTHGIPLEVVSDNMPFNSYECKKFAKEWGFKFLTSSPRYPKSNGLAERAVQIAKNMLRKCTDISNALLEYRMTPISASEKSPAELLFNRKLQTKLPIKTELLIPSKINYEKEKEKLEQKRQEYKSYYDRSVRERKEFEEGENVVVKEGRIWEPGKIIRKLEEPRSYIVQKENGNEIRRNSSHLRQSLNEGNFNQNHEFILNEGVDIPSNDIPSNDISISINRATDKSRRPVKLPQHFKDFHMY
ncbi:uncharacterized protein K02A2.6-like [Sitophilus oryzae]|uniref:RNA-directed DNA polymerase n=1 Tax=Sitophilus oryzae TaxID=7048 RepID=A0A6J2YVI5_SITOR|nr:uncharacterized protein K02A2.6-like [Sitophilus oryzae]XP_030761774.1 uncharacterized protein K02A2.6-like [Sitophilus oryzae]XP_030767292.1 uncharacterized protein K02A2.6-like [Sitophilus oryzae]